MSSEAFLAGLRSSAPYVHSHRGRTFVIAFGGEAAARDDFRQLIFDIALLQSLGIRIVLVHGARPQVEARINERGLKARLVDGQRVTDSDTLGCVKDVVGSLRIDIESLLSTGLVSTQMGGASIRVSGGNLLTARPLGIHDGVDMQYSGAVRRVDTAGIRQALDKGDLVLISPMGYSPTGEVFNLRADEVANRVAIELNADKLVYLHSGAPAYRQLNADARQLRPADTRALLKKLGKRKADLAALIRCAVDAAENGVDRVHLVSQESDGALLAELFTRDGVGTMIWTEGYESMRAATIDDVGGVLALIEPLEQSGVLVARSREQLELDIEHFSVMTRDDAVVACCAMIPYTDDEVGELACVAVHPEYQHQGRANALLNACVERAKKLGLKRLFALTTQAPHWFVERSFREATLANLPVSRKEMYNFHRNSKVLIRDL